MPSGNIGYNPLKGTRELGVASLNLQNSDVAIQGLNDSFKAYSTAQQNQQIRLKEENRNLKLNSLKGLYMQAFDNPDFAAKSAASMFNKIESAKDKDSINSIYKELESIQEKAQDNKYLFDLAEVGDSLVNWYGRATSGVITRPDTLSKSKESVLSKTDADLGEISKWLTPGDLMANIKNHVYEVDNKTFGTNLLKSFNSPDEFNAKLKKALTSPTPQVALDDLINLKLQDNFVTRGNDFYREGPDATKFQQDALNAFKNPDDLSKKYFKYDLENETLGSIKASIVGELTNLIGQPENKDNERLIASYRQSLELIDKRQKDNSKIYGVNQYEEGFRAGSKGRGGAANATTSGVVDLTNFFFRDDFEGTTYKRALYQPQVLSYDSKGRPVMSNQFMYEKEDGSVGFNFAAIPEAGMHMTAQMLPVLATGSLVGGVVGGLAQATKLGGVSRAAAGLERGYEQLNKVSAFNKSVPLIGGELNIADRIATLTTVTANTLPSMLAEEKKWGGNYFKRATGKALVEGLTEGIGFPDIGALKFKRFEADLATSAKRAAGVELKFSDNLRNFVNSGKQFAIMGAKQNAVEALEEELSLLGNALMETTVMPEEFVGRDKTEITGEALLETFVESFAAGAIYSGITTGFQGLASGNKTHVQNQADWEAANNPELFKAKLKQLNERGSLSDQQYSQAVLEVNRKAGILKGLFGFDNIRDAKTLLEDKDEQYRYYINHLRQDELVNIDYDQLTDQEKQVFASRKIADKIDTKGRERLREIRKEFYNLSTQTVTVETESKLASLRTEYGLIKRANVKTLNKKELTAEEEKVLREKGIIGEKDFEFTQADLDAELAKVTTDILKTQKRIEKYANLSEEEKAKVISDSYDEKIADLNKITDPNELIQSRLNVDRDLEYLKLKGNYKDKAQIANKERLLDAYGERFDQLVSQRDENGRNSLEQSIENIDYEALESSSNLYQATQLLNQIQSNRDFINQDMFNLASENLKNTQERILAGLVEATPEKRAEVLATFLDQAAPITATYAYNVDKVNEEFPGLNFTVEELDAAREAFIQRRAEVRGMQIADEPATDLTPEESTDAAEFSGVVATPEEKATPVDESGKSPVTDKYSNHYNKKINDLKVKYPQNFGNIFLQYLINSMANKFSRNTPEFKQLESLLNQLVSKEITEAQFNQAVSEIETKLKKDIELRKKNKTSTVTAEDKLASLDLLKYMAGRFAREESVPVSTAASVKAATPTPVVSNATPTPKTQDVTSSFPTVVAKNKALDSQLEIRLQQLRDLASPLRTAGIEFDRNNERSTDPADIRNAKAIDQLAGQPYQTRIQSRKGTVMMFLATKFPDKTEEQLNQDFAAIEQVFENTNLTEAQWNSLGEAEQDAILQPMHDLLGKEYFDKAALTYFVVNKGKGFTVDSAVLVTSATPEGDLILFDGYPLQLNFPKEGRLSRRLIEEYKKNGYNEQDLIDVHAKVANNLARLKTYLSENTDRFIDTDYTVSDGVVLKSAAQKKASEITNETLANAKLADFALAESEGQSIFGKIFKFTLGRLYFNNNGNPIVLSNTSIREEEADALAEMLFSENLPKEFPDQNSLERYLVSLINIIDRKNRIHFFPNTKFPSTTEAVQYPLDVVQTVYVDGKPVNKKLNKEEFKAFLVKSFYKADKSMLSSGDPMLRVSLVDGKPTVTKQSYTEYIKDTHTFPVTSNGELIGPINKIIYPDSQQVLERSVDILPKVQPTPQPISPKPITPAQTPQPVAQPTLGDKLDEFIAIPYEEAINYAKVSPTAQAFNIYSAFLNFLTPDIYNQAVQTLSDNPQSVEYKIVGRKLSGGNTTTLTPEIREYNSNTEGDFVLAVVTVGDKKIPLMLMRKEQGMGGNLFRNTPLIIITGTNPSNFKSTTKEEYLASKAAAVTPTPVTPVEPVVQPTPKQSLADRLNSQSAGEMFDEEEVKEAQKAKEDCINPAKQVRDQIKKKPKL